MPPHCILVAYFYSPGPSEREGPRPVPHYDAEGRLSSLEWHGNGDAASRRVDYGYDSEGRIAVATNALFVVLNSYHGGGYEQGYTLKLPSGATLVRHVVRNAHRTHPIEAVQNFFVTASGVTNALPSFAYTLDGLMRPVQRNADEFAYDARSQLTSATLRSANTNAFAYVYDTAGNPTAASDSDASVAYAANRLNQYEAVAETMPAYDIDGNLLTNGVWTYAWDAANRLAAACSNGVCVVSNAYDALSRRVLKVTPTETRTFLYDGWNMVREEVRDNVTGAIAETRDYYWGRDLSGSLQGAGGVGGLLAYTRNGELLVPVYDHIGNVVAVVNDSGAIVAAYEYDPFGNIVAQSGPEADEVPFRFSTKYLDAETRKDIALILRRCGYSNSDFSTIQSFVNSRIGASRYDGRRWFFNGPNCATFVHDALGNKEGITDGIVPINWDKDRFGIGLAPRPEELRSLLDSISGWEVIYRAADWKGSGSEEKPVSFSQK